VFTKKTGKIMNIDKLREELKEDEGCKYEIYLDHLGLPTHGIGHLITEWDEEYEKKVGTEVSEERVNECFAKDVETVLEDCKVLYSNFDELPEEVQLILANMMFNMGRTRLSKFKKLKLAVDDEDWMEASIQMEDSKWYKQVPNRAERLCKRMREKSWLFNQ
jgi:lysozyme